MVITINIKQDNQVFILDEDGDFVCAHADYDLIQDEVDTMREGEHDTYYQKVWECNHCAAWQYAEYYWDGSIESPKTEEWVGEC